MSRARLLVVGRYRFGADTVVDVTPERLRELMETPVPVPITVRYDASRVIGAVTRFWIDGDALWGEVSEELVLCPAFTDANEEGRAEVVGISAVGHGLIEHVRIDPLPREE
jgi:hypothetical protein